MAQQLARTNGSQLSAQPANTVAQAIQTLTQFPKAGRKVAASASERLFACYPQATPNRPQEYTAAVIALLEEYPAEIVERVTDPKTGLATRCKFLPTIAEITEALERAMEPHRKAWRDRHDQQTALPPPGRVEPTPEERERVQKLTESIRKIGTTDPLEDLRNQAKAMRDANSQPKQSERQG